jgi:hypothetical protein
VEDGEIVQRLRGQRRQPQQQVGGLRLSHAFRETALPLGFRIVHRGDPRLGMCIHESSSLLKHARGFRGGTGNRRQIVRHH